MTRGVVHEVCSFGADRTASDGAYRVRSQLGYLTRGCLALVRFRCRMIYARSKTEKSSSLALLRNGYGTDEQNLAQTAYEGIIGVSRLIASHARSSLRRC